MLEVRGCLECAAPVQLRIQRDLTRKFFCCKPCAARWHGRARDMRPLWAKAWAPEANAKKGRTGARHNKWVPVGTKRQTHDMGYIEVKIAEPDVWEYEHRVVTDAPPELVVHHKDENVQNNDPSNLELMDGNDHLQMHAKRWRESLVSCKK